AVPILVINTCSMLFSICMTAPIQRAFDDLKYFRLRLSMVMLPVSWVVLYIGLRQGGLFGVITAVFCLRALDTAVMVTIIGRQLRMSVKDLLHLEPSLRAAAAAAASSFVAFLARIALASQPPQVVGLVSAGLFGAVYLVVGGMTGAMT